MDWLDKARTLAECKKNKAPGGPYFYDIHLRESKWSQGQLDKLKETYPFLPKSYFDFIKEFDSCDLAFAMFYGSVGEQTTSLKIKELDTYLRRDYFPLAKDADGSIFLIDNQARVCLWDKYDYDFEQEPELIAETFEEFVGECLMGKRYREFDNIQNNPYYDFLVDQGWA